MKRMMAILLGLGVLFFAAACAVSPGSTATPTPTSPATSSPSPSTVPPTPTSTPTPTPAATPTPDPASGSYRVVDAYPALRFTQPVLYEPVPDGNGNAVVVERTGRVRIFADRSDAPTSTVFLDLRGLITAKGQEQGLLGLAFDPDYATNGFFYVDYTTADSTVIARYRRSADDPAVADPTSGTVLLTFKQPYANHNGGQLAFGPDGHLYIATGDGGSAGDPQNRAQDRAVLLGKILRIDVAHPSAGNAYGIPSDNPFAGNTQGYREEIFAYGLRNPWRFSFDAQGVLWAGDVGQDRIEEVDRIVKGGNYGWNVLEGTLAYKDLAGVDRATLIAPVWEYRHPLGEAITGGFVYAGSLLSHAKGTYIYGDYLTGRIWALWFDAAQAAQNELLLDTGLLISSFGVDASGELRVVDLSGKVYRLVE